MSELLLGVSLGFGAGMSPGPLLTLVITSTLERGFGAGLRIALAPVLTDAPLIATALVVSAALPPLLLSGLTVAGGVFVAYLGIDALRASRKATLGPRGAFGRRPSVVPSPGPREAGDDDTREPERGVWPPPSGRDLRRGAIVNLLNPHPWLFWVGAGGPILAGAWRKGPLHAGLFLLGFYLLLVGCMTTLALAVAGGRARLSDRTFRVLLGAGGGVLCLLALLLIRQGIAGLAGQP